MGSESKHDGYGGGESDAAVAATVPATAKKVVQSVKEIVNCCSELEIYAVLEECDMDPNRAVEKLLAQDIFHKVRSKRERRKEMKEASDFRTRGSNGLIRGGGKTGTGSDRNVTKSGLAQVTYNEHVKPANKGEVGPIGTSVMPSTHIVGNSAKGANGRPSLGTSDSISVLSQVSPGLQTSLLGMSKGHLSMADIVRMGRTSQNAVSHDGYTASGVSASGNSESTLHFQNHSEQQVFDDEWPVNERPITGNSQAQNIFVSSNANGPSEHSSLRETAVSFHRNCDLKAAQASWEDFASDDVMSNTGLGSNSNSNSKDTCTSDLHSSYGHHEDVSSAASDFQRLSIRESKLEEPSSEDKLTLVLPNHLHFQSLADSCAHLSFGSYNGNAASSVILASNLSRNGLEEKSAAVDGSSTQFSDGSSVYNGDKQLELDVLRGIEDDKNGDFLSSPQQELLKHIIPEEALGHESNMVSVSNSSLQPSHWMAHSLPLKQPGLQSRSRSNFPTAMMMQAESNSIPGDVLAFLRSQSQPIEYSNAVSSANNSANSISEVMERGAFALPKRSALPQDLTMQSSSVHFQQLPDMERHYMLPQNQSYMATVNSQQPFSSNTPYNQSPVDMKYSISQNRNEFLMSRLPPASARDAYGYGNLGSSIYSPGSYLSNPSPGYMMPSSNSNEILPSQYNGGRNLSSIPQHNLSQWDYGAESRSSFLPERTQQYNFLGQQQNMASMSQYVNPEYSSDLNHSQRRVVEELQRPGGFQSKQLHQLWQHIH